MNVTPIAQTVFFGMHDNRVTDADALVEFAGRNCYQSFHKPNPATAENSNYMLNIINQGHFSVMEHSSVTFLINDVSRSFTHELVRHRHLSFSELSQRFVDANQMHAVVPPAFKDRTMPHNYTTSGEEDLLEEIMNLAMGNYNYLKAVLLGRGFTKKQASEAARAVLPNMASTSIVVTGNLRAWREFIQKRNHPAADAEMQLVAKEILRHMLLIAPNSFQDFEG